MDMKATYKVLRDAHVAHYWDGREDSPTRYTLVVFRSNWSPKVERKFSVWKRINTIKTKEQVPAVWLERIKKDGPKTEDVFLLIELNGCDEIKIVDGDAD